MPPHLTIGTRVRVDAGQPLLCLAVEAGLRDGGQHGVVHAGLTF